MSIFSYLSGRNISEACTIAQESGDHRLALLMAQAAGSQIPRHMLAQQLDGWAELGVGLLFTSLLPCLVQYFVRMKLYTTMLFTQCVSL